MPEIITPDFGSRTPGTMRADAEIARAARKESNASTKMTTSQISDLHAALVSRLGIGIDPAKVRRALEDVGFAWDKTCSHSVLRLMGYVDGDWRYICADDEHPSCHEKFKTLGSSSDELGIEALDLSVRAYNVLKREGVHTIGQLCSKAWYDLADMRNMGDKAIHNIQEQLAVLGRELKESHA